MYHGQLCKVCQRTMILVPIGIPIYPICKHCQQQHEKEREQELCKEAS